MFCEVLPAMAWIICIPPCSSAVVVKPCLWKMPWSSFRTSLNIQKVAWKKSWFATKISRYRDRGNFDQTRCSDISCWNLKDALFCISCRCFFGEKMWRAFRPRPWVAFTSQTLKMDGWFIRLFPFGAFRPILRGTPCYTSRECIVCHVQSHFQKEMCVYVFANCKHLELRHVKLDYRWFIVYL